MEAAKAAPERFGVYSPNPKVKRLDQVREVVRLKHYSVRTEQTYVQHRERHSPRSGSLGS